MTSQRDFAGGMAGNDTTSPVHTFDDSANSVGAYNVTNSVFRLSVYDIHGVLLATGVEVELAGQLLFSGMGQIKTAIFSAEFESGYGIDDLRVEAVASDVTEPASMALIGMGTAG